MSPTGWWPCHCTSTGQHGSIELEMALIGPATVELYHPQGFWCPTDNPTLAQQANDCRFTSTGQDGSIELELHELAQRYWEVQCPQEFPTGMPKHARWANDLAIAHLRANTVPQNLRWTESAQQYWGYTFCKNWGIQWECHIWPCRCPSTGQDGSELEIEKIGPVVVELQHLQELWCPMGMPKHARLANDLAVRNKMTP